MEIFHALVFFCYNALTWMVLQYRTRRNPGNASRSPMWQCASPHTNRGLAEQHAIAYGTPLFIVRLQPLTA